MLVSACSSVTPGLRPSPTDRPSRVFFVSATLDDKGTWQPTRTMDVRFRPGRSGYGWVAEMPTSRDVAVTETLTLPKAVRSWPKSMAVGGNGRVGTVSRRLTPADHMAHGFWTIAEGDPIGDYELTVAINGEAHHFRFRVVADAPPSERQVLDDIARLVAKKKEAERLAAACTSRAWGWDAAEYDDLGPAEVRSHVDGFAARHTTRADALAGCQRTLEANLTELTALADAEIALIARVPALAAKVNDWKRFLDASIGRLRYRTAIILSLAIDLERKHAAYFQDLQRRNAGGPLIQPRELRSLEYELFRAGRADLAHAVQEAELLDVLAPSPKTRARLELARIHESLYRALDAFQVGDGRSHVAKIQAVRRELRGVSLMILQAADNKEIEAGFPTVLDHYREAFKAIEATDKYLAGFEALAQDPALYQQLRAEHSTDFARLLAAATAQIGETFEQAEQRLLAADQMLRSE